MGVSTVEDIRVASAHPDEDDPGTHWAKGGGGFLTAPVPREGIFTREKLSEEQRQFGKTVRKFVDAEVMPHLDEIEHKNTISAGGVETPIAIHILRKSGELGLLSAAIPEEYGGLGLDITTSAHIAESSFGSPSLNATSGAHCGIGTMPIVIFGNETQKQQYLPKLATGELVGCYALTEPGSGSDAFSGKTKAVLNAEGTHYTITGEKQFITNGGWADLGVVFASVNGQYSAFIVDLHSQGVRRGVEEKKMGIKGSSTTALIFEDVMVPRENLLGKIGDGATIALNILNLGRIKLGFGALGTCRYATGLTVAYARERKQFGQPVITFDMQKGKLGQMAARIYALDSMAYRTVGEIDEGIARAPKDERCQEGSVGVLRAFALEASIIKIAGSETLRDVLDTAVKMHGGYGYIEEYQVERLARDNVIDMIFEGTNDINRLVICDSLIRNIFASAIGFREFMERVDSAVRRRQFEVPAAEGPLGFEMARVYAAKRAVADAIQEMIIHCGKDVKNEQQAMHAVADAMITLYGMDSTVARVHACGYQAIPVTIAKLIVHEGSGAIARLTAEVVSHVVSGGQLEAKLAKLEALNRAHFGIVDAIALRRRIAEAIIEAGGYNL